MHEWITFLLLGLCLRACGFPNVHAWACVGKSVLISLLAHAALVQRGDDEQTTHASSLSLLHEAGELFVAFEAYDLVHMSVAGTLTRTFALHHALHGTLCAYGLVHWNTPALLVPNAVALAQETSSILLNLDPLLSATHRSHRLPFRQCFAVAFFAYRVLGLGLTLFLVPIEDNMVFRLGLLASWGMQLAWARKVWRYLPGVLKT